MYDIEIRRMPVIDWFKRSRFASLANSPTDHPKLPGLPDAVLANAIHALTGIQCYLPDNNPVMGLFLRTTIGPEKYEALIPLQMQHSFYDSVVQHFPVSNLMLGIRQSNNALTLGGLIEDCSHAFRNAKNNGAIAPSGQTGSTNRDDYLYRTLFDPGLNQKPYLHQWTHYHDQLQLMLVRYIVSVRRNSNHKYAAGRPFLLDLLPLLALMGDRRTKANSTVMPYQAQSPDRFRRVAAPHRALTGSRAHVMLDWHEVLLSQFKINQYGLPGPGYANMISASMWTCRMLRYTTPWMKWSAALWGHEQGRKPTTDQKRRMRGLRLDYEGLTNHLRPVAAPDIDHYGPFTLEANRTGERKPWNGLATDIDTRSVLTVWDWFDAETIRGMPAIFKDGDSSYGLWSALGRREPLARNVDSLLEQVAAETVDMLERAIQASKVNSSMTRRDCGLAGWLHREHVRAFGLDGKLCGVPQDVRFDAGNQAIAEILTSHEDELNVGVRKWGEFSDTHQSVERPEVTNVPTTVEEMMELVKSEQDIGLDKSEHKPVESETKPGDALDGLGGHDQPDYLDGYEPQVENLLDDTDEQSYNCIYSN